MTTRRATLVLDRLPDPVAERLSSPWARRLWRVAEVLLVLALLVWVGSKVVEEPLRRTLERRVNASLKGYTATIGKVDLQLAGFAVVLSEVTLVQNALPDPPLAFLPRWRTSVQWRALLHGALVADVRFTRPQFFVTFPQAEKEVADPKSPSERGWQDAVTAVYPLEINELRIDDGALTYFDTSGSPPIVLRRFSMRAEDIRNVRSVAGRYPSPIAFDATLGDGGRVSLDGRADFLAKPQATVRGTFDVRGIALKSYEAGLRHLGLEVQDGRVEASGRIESTARQKRLAIARATIDRPRIDYVKSAPEATGELGTAAKAAAKAEPAPPIRVDIDRAVVRDGRFAIVDRASKPPYRLELSDTEATIRGFSNEKAARRGSGIVRGRFVDTGSLALDTTFASGAARPDFALDLRLEDVDLSALNDFLRAQAGFDVVAGRLSVYSQLTVQNGAVKGYVKPLFRDVDVYDAQQDREKNPLRKLYEAAVGATSGVLANRPREEVATITDLSGPIENPNASTLEVIGGLLRNAFIKAILPGLEPRRR